VHKFHEKATKVIEKYRLSGKRISTAESCTGGLLSASITSIAGSSDVFDRGYVTYSNESKSELLGVDKSLISKYGAVSEEVSIQMALGAIEKSGCDTAISITGIAGPERIGDLKEVGLVYITYIDSDKRSVTQEHNFSGNREEIRDRTVFSALDLLLSF